MTGIELRQEAAIKLQAAHEITNKKEQTEEDKTAVDTLMDQYDALVAQAADADRSARVVNAAMTAAKPQPRVTGPEIIIKKDKEVGVSNFTRLLVKQVRDHDAEASRILNTTSTFIAEGTDSDGGYLTPTEARVDILGADLEPGNVLQDITRVQVNSKTVTWPTNARHYFNNLGPTSENALEGAIATASKIELGQLSISVKKYSAYVPVSVEWLQDAPQSGLDFILREGRKAILGQIENHVLNGASGATTTPKGILTAAAAKLIPFNDSGDDGYLGAGDSSGKGLFRALGAMYLSMPASLRSGARWLMNDTNFRELMAANLNQYSNGIYMPGGNIAGKPFDTLLGQPIRFSDFAPAVSTKGSVAFWHPSAYVGAFRDSDVQVAKSDHYLFGEDMIAIKFTMRFGGSPVVTSQISMPDGSRKSTIVLIDASYSG